MAKLINIILHLAERYRIDDEPCPRTYIFPDGSFIHLDCYNSHQDMKNWLKGEFGYSAEEVQVENYGCIRVNLDTEGFIALSAVKPTDAQYEALLRELDDCWSKCSWKYGKFMLIEPERDENGQYLKDGFHFYSIGADRYTSDEFVKIIKRYYATGRLVEDVSD